MKELQTVNVFKREQSPFFAATITYLIIMVVFVGLRIFAQANLLVGLGKFQDLVYSLIIQVGIIFGLCFLMFKTFSKKSARQIFADFKFRSISVKAVFLCIGLALCLLVFNTAFNSVFSMILSLFGYAPAGGAAITSYPLYLFLISLFASAVLPGFCEEFANRGMLLYGLRGLGIKKAILISGLLFGLMHFNVGQFGYAFLVGCFFAFVCIATGSIIPSMIMHFLNNAFVEYLSFANVNHLLFGDFYASVASLVSGDFLSSVFLIFILLFVIMFLFAWLTYALIKECRQHHARKIGADICQSLNQSDIHVESIKIDMSMQKIFQTKQMVFPTAKAKVPLAMCLCLGTIITLMTLIWNCL